MTLRATHPVMAPPSLKTNLALWDTLSKTPPGHGPGSRLSYIRPLPCIRVL